MRKLIWALALALPLAFTPGRASAEGLNFKFGIHGYFRICTDGAGGGSLAPWYDYYPMGAQFQQPAAPFYPYYPAPAAAPVPPPGGKVTPPPAAPSAAPPLNPASYQPVGYYYYVPYPYGYGR